MSMSLRGTGQSLSVLIAVSVILTAVPSARAEFLSRKYSFRDLSNGSNIVDETEFVMEVANWKDVAGTQTLLTNQVRFQFTHSAAAGSSSYIDGVYFDDGALLGIAEIVNGPGVRFEQKKVAPPDLPGGEELDPDFQTTAGFLADVQQNAADGVNGGEYVDIIFDLKDDPLGSKVYLTFQDVIDSLHNGQHLEPSDNNKPYTVQESFKTGKGLSLRVGLQVQGLGPGGNGSDQLVNVPGPSTVALVSMGLLSIGTCSWFGRGRGKSPAQCLRSGSRGAHD